jgi:hypothetical protein
MSNRTKTRTENGIKHTTTFSEVTLDKLMVSEFQKAGTKTAQLRQTVTTVSVYPSKRIENDKQKNLFSMEEFGFGDGQTFSNTENRVAFIDVPENATEEQIKSKLKVANAAGATIYKVLSNQPILTNDQKRAIATGFNGVTMDRFANSQVVRYPQGHSHEGQLCLDANNKVQYRRTYFWNEPLEDQDVRSTDPADVYMSPEIELEYNAVSAIHTALVTPNILEGQTL